MFPPKNSQRPARLLTAFSLVLAIAGCGIVDETQLTESIAASTPNPALARDADVASIFHLAKAGQEAPLAARLSTERTNALASPLPSVTPSVYPTLETAPPTPTPTPLPSPSAAASGGAVADARPSVNPSPSPSPSANGSPAATTSPTPIPTPRVAYDPALTLALFKIDPSTYRQLFVENYPIDANGVEDDYGTRLARARLTKDGTRFPISAIARFAASGDETAAVRLFAATAVSSGDLAGAYADAVAYVASKNPGEFGTALALLPMGVRLRVASTSHWCLRPPKAFLEKTGDDPDRIAMASVIRGAMAGCNAKPVRRHASKHAKTHGKKAKNRRA